MNLYLARHGEPERIKEDSLRCLTESGRKNLFNLMLNWKTKIPKIDLIICSPYKRTHQTAEVINIMFEVPNGIIIDNNLMPGCSSAYIEELLNIYRDYEDILIVAHNPELSYHISYFTEHSELIEFGYATLAKIIFNGRTGYKKGKFDFKI